MAVTVFCPNDLCSFSSWEESYHTPFCGACPVPVLAILHRPNPRCSAARGALLTAIPDPGGLYGVGAPTIPTAVGQPGIGGTVSRASHHRRCCLVASQGEKETAVMSMIRGIFRAQRGKAPAIIDAFKTLSQGEGSLWAYRLEKLSVLICILSHAQMHCSLQHVQPFLLTSKY
jgi:hypothetical protein